jgi:anaerobic magnesium-protoporphyrin IX monomethyl ester cyclase
MVKERVNVEWACLSRTDNLDADLLARMKAAGCKRIYFGMESGSQRMLDLYHKSMDVSSAMQVLHLCRKAGIESAAFFMSGHPDETDTDFQLTLDFAIDARLNFASFNPLTPYPGTPLFNQLRDRIDFSIYPYRNQWKYPSIYDSFTLRKKRFYRGFYLRIGFVLWNLRNIPEHVGEVFSMGLGLMRYLAWDGKFVISGLKGAKDV